ncbi:MULTISPECIES: Gfo/Idh/MocA family protein [Nocardioides]|uniref:Gfo/Idh/MocA family protein n=1 Tax=Nocardioides vastitatis TaxID=2568655 RepID=A0ABW0ZEU2_9ACTN|nr:Gfo/Idh/MocA family oxidoreductase [Nocardioides sp.]THI92747.1 Gfo/Idh/MocA family oxidoreductase [Nocardioides sp.]
MTEQLGVAVIGYSFMGKAHSNAWRNVNAFFPDTPPVRQQVLVGRDASAVKGAAAQYGWAESATDWTSVVARDDVDIVDICTPGDSHHEIALAALAAGKHVLVEKPLANSVAEAEEMVAAAVAAAARGVRSGIGFNYRRVPALDLARRLIAEGRIGVVRQVRASYLQDWLADAAAPMTWRLRRESAGSGALGDLGSHVVDLVQHLLSEPVVSATGHLRTFVPTRTGPDGPEDVTVDDAAWANLVTASGAVASLEVSRMATGRKNGLALEVYGDRGTIGFDLERLNELQVQDGRGGPTAQVSGSQRIVVTEPDHPWLGAFWPPGHVLGWDHTFIIQAAELLMAIDQGTDPTPSFAEGLVVQRVLAAIERSAAQQGTRVDVVRDKED